MAIAPEKDDIFITVNVHEGEVYKVSEVKLAGTFVVPEAELKRYLLVQAGQTFSQQAHHLDAGAAAEPARPGRLRVREGRTGADARRTTSNEVSLTFFVDPGNRVYVRNITFARHRRHQR